MVARQEKNLSTRVDETGAGLAQKPAPSSAKPSTGARAGLTKAAKATGQLVKGHPLAAAGALLGAGVLVGVAAERAFHHRPTVSEVLVDALKSGAAKATRRLAAKTANGVEKAGAKAAARLLK